MKTLKLAFIGGAISLTAFSASAETFRWASNTDPQTMDPHAVNSAPVLSFLTISMKVLYAEIRVCLLRARSLNLGNLYPMIMDGVSTCVKV